MSAEGRPKTSTTLVRYPQSGCRRHDHDGEYPEDHGPSLMAEYPEPLAAFLATNRYLKEVKLTLMWVGGRWMQLQAATVGAFPGHGAIASSVPVAPSTLRSIQRSNSALARAHGIDAGPLRTSSGSAHRESDQVKLGGVGRVGHSRRYVPGSTRVRIVDRCRRWHVPCSIVTWRGCCHQHRRDKSRSVKRASFQRTRHLRHPRALEI